VNGDKGVFEGFVFIDTEPLHHNSFTHTLYIFFAILITIVAADRT
jgi:hypothetical protein